MTAVKYDLEAISKLFKAYDLRGTYPLLSQDIYYWMGYGVVTQVLVPENLPSKIAVFCDHRYTSPDFYRAYCSGILEAGGELVTLGLGTTDMMYAATQLLNIPGAIITASHNPKDDNGCKMVKFGSQMLGLSAGLDKVRDFVLQKLASGEDFEIRKEFVDDLETKRMVIDFYKDKIEQVAASTHINQILSQRGKKMKIVVDAGNGMGGYIMQLIQDIYGRNIDFVPMYFELDGTYPNHPADPSNPKNTEDLRKRVVDEQADLGVAFDGDADRAYFIDEKGEMMDGNFVVSVFASQFLKDLQREKNPRFNPAIAYSQPQSRCVPHTVLSLDGVPVPTKQGHIFIKENMSKYRAVYGGEASGHHYYGDFNYMDAGAITMAKMIQILVTNDSKPTDLIVKYQGRYHLSGEHNFNMGNGVNFETVKEKLKREFSQAEFSELDGLSVIYPDWKVNVRMSNTEPLLRINVECIGKDEIQQKMTRIRQVLGV